MISFSRATEVKSLIRGPILMTSAPCMQATSERKVDSVLIERCEAMATCPVSFAARKARTTAVTVPAWLGLITAPLAWPRAAPFIRAIEVVADDDAGRLRGGQSAPGLEVLFVERVLEIADPVVPDQVR